LNQYDKNDGTLGKLGQIMGEAFALATAVAWAIAVILFKKSGETVHPIALNLFKNLLAIALFVPTVYIFGEILLRKASAYDYLLLFLSGILGISLADTFYFIALNSVGAGVMAIVSCLYSPFIIALSMTFLGERLAFAQILGVTAIISAVILATYTKQGARSTDGNLTKGIIFGALGTFANAVGVVMIKPLLDVSPLVWISTYRIMGGIIGLVIILIFVKDRSKIISSLKNRQSWGFTVSGSFMGAYLSMFLWLAGMKFTLTSIAAALNQTSAVFIFIFAILFLSEKFSYRRSLGVVLAMIGVLLVTYGG
jgi:drug/metabolite transporter (DMT)-like permease